MAAADKKSTYTAAEVAALESTIQTQQSQIQAQQAQIEELTERVHELENKISPSPFQLEFQVTKDSLKKLRDNIMGAFRK